MLKHISTKNRCFFLLILSMLAFFFGAYGIAILSVSATGNKTTSVTLGDYISLGKYDGKDIVWRCVDIDENGPLMLADKIIDTLPYDAKTNDNARTRSHSRNYKRDTYGSNYWKDSNMRSWLNSTATAGEVKWLCGNSPKTDYVDGSGYDGKAGFLNSFEKAEIATMKTVTQRSLVSHPEYNSGIYEGDARSDLEYYSDIEGVANNFASAYYENSTEKVFLLDVKQVNAVWQNYNDYYIATNNQGVKWPYWLRTPVTNCNHDMRYVQSNGTVGRESPFLSYLGVRPAFYLDTEYYVVTSGNGTAASPYIGSALNKQESEYTISESDDNPNQEWDVSTENNIKLNLGQWYSKDSKYSNPTIPVYTIQKTRSDTENMVIVICGEGYTKSQQGKFIKDVKNVWDGAMQYEPYRSFADGFNVYALCTASESSFENGESTFFDVVVGSNSSASISGSLRGNILKNHIFERCIGPEFIEKIHDAHIKNETDPNTISDDEYAPYYYVHNYIRQFALIVNTSRYFGDAYTNLQSGFHYFITPSDNYRARQIFAHELGHGLLGLGDEYYTDAAEQIDLTSLNIAYNVDPQKVKWKQLLGFRNTYSCPHKSGATSYNSSYKCVMRDTSYYSFCEVCRLQGYKRLSQLVDGKTLYVADPEVREYDGQYTQLSDFADTTINGFYSFTNYRNNVLLSGTSKNRFNSSMAGKQIELRTIVQNLSDTVERRVTMRVWIKHLDGSVAISTMGEALEATQTFAIPVWSEKSKFWPKGAMEYAGSNFDSGLMNCSMIYQIPANAILRDGDTVAFTVVDENGNVLATDSTETQTYANVTVRYCFKDGSEIPNTESATIPVPVGTMLDWVVHPTTLYGYTFIDAEGLNQTVNSNGSIVTYYYAKQTEEHTHEWGDWITDGTHHWHQCTVCKEKLDIAGHSGGIATCLEKARCEVCGDNYGNLGGHTYSWVAEVDSTVEKEGRKSHYYDDNCKKYFNEEKQEVMEDSLVIPKKIVLTIIGGSFEGFDSSVVTLNSNEAITLVAHPAEKGKVFVGWKNENGEIIDTSELIHIFYASKSQTLTAVYTNISKEGLSGGAIVGIAIGSVVVVGLGLFVLIWFVIKKKSIFDLLAVFKKK